MHKYLPSKRFTLILLSLILALGLIYTFSWIANRIKSKPAGVLLTGVAAQDKVQQFMALDSDNDGLRDWEEALYKTDPHNPDTDGDGTTDGEEVALNRDPLKANAAPKGSEPNDKIDAGVIAADKKATDDFASLSNTDRLSRTLFSEYLATKKLGTTLSTADKENIINDFVSNLPTQVYAEYSLKDFSTTTTDAAAVKNYGNQVAEIILKNLATKTADIYTILYNYASSEAEVAPTKPLEDLTLIIAKNQATINALLKLSVPGEAANGHLALINAFYKINQDLLSLEKAPADIINTLVTLNQYDANALNLSQILISLAQYIYSQKYNIQYAPADFGYKLFNGIMMGN